MWTEQDQSERLTLMTSHFYPMFNNLTKVEQKGPQYDVIIFPLFCTILNLAKNLPSGVKEVNEIATKRISID